MIPVLYVDDEPGLLEISKLFLERSGQFCVDTIASAPAALALLKTKNYDAIISDYQMPEMDGIEFSKKIRTSGNTIPFILFTGRGREEVVIQALNEGADFYLQKGNDPKSQFAELGHQIRQACQQKRAEATIRDLERREADIINFLPDATFAIDTKGVVIAWNRAIEEMTGVSAAKMAGKGEYQYAIPFYGSRRPVVVDMIFNYDEKVAGYYSSMLREGETFSAETHFRHRNGHQIWVTTKASPLYNREGGIVGAIEVIRDITEWRRAEDALKTANRQLSLLTSITRHDINNQMTELLGYLHVLEKKRCDPSFHEYFQKAAHAAKRISTIIRFTNAYEAIGVNAPVWQNCHTLVDTATKQSLLGQILVKNEFPVGAEVLADPLIINVFCNLIDNAVRHSAKIATIRFSLQASGDNHIIICEDDGDGVAWQEKEKIFERGFGKNTGLGLFLSREILSITGITISETGESGKGARFEMTVPKDAYRLANVHC